MYSVCLKCGEWELSKIVHLNPVIPDQALVVCPICDKEYSFAHLSLFMVGGPSGAGQSTVSAALVKKTLNHVVLDSDILWGMAYTAPEERSSYMDMWLRVCHNIHQSGRSVLLFGAGLNPENVEDRPALRYFSVVHYLGLVCDEADLVARLRARTD